MQVKINKDIRQYEEAVFFGLSMWQFIFCVLACIAAVGSYVLLKDKIGAEAVSWVCILSAFPFVALGFIKYNGMTADKILWAFLKSEILTSKHLVFRPMNFYHYAMKLEEKRGDKLNGKINQLCLKKRQRTLSDS